VVQGPRNAHRFSVRCRSNHVRYDELDAVGLTDFVNVLEGAPFEVQTLVDAHTFS